MDMASDDEEAGRKLGTVDTGSIANDEDEDSIISTYHINAVIEVYESNCSEFVLFLRCPTSSPDPVRFLSCSTCMTIHSPWGKPTAGAYKAQTGPTNACRPCKA